LSLFLENVGKVSYLEFRVKFSSYLNKLYFKKNWHKTRKMNSKLIRQEYYDEDHALNEQEFKGTH